MGDGLDGELWVAMSCSAFVDHLHRARRGEDPDMLLMELYANGDTDRVDGER